MAIGLAKQGAWTSLVAYMGWIATSVALTLAPRAASAQTGPTTPSSEPPIPLIVERAEGASPCIDATALAREVVRQVSRSALVASSEARPGAIVVSIRREGAAYIADLDIAGSHRRLVDAAPECVGLGEALSVMIAIVLDRPPNKGPVVTAAPPLAPKLALVRRPELIAGPSLTRGLLGDAWRPMFSALAGVSIAERWSFAAGAMWAPARAIEFGPGTIDVGLLAAQLQGCFVLRGDPRRGASVGVCFEPAAGRLSAASHGFSLDGAVSRPWLSLGAGVHARGPIRGPLGWWAHASAASLVGPRAELSVGGLSGVAYEGSLGWGSVGAGLSMTIF